MYLKYDRLTKVMVYGRKDKIMADKLMHALSTMTEIALLWNAAILRNFFFFFSRTVVGRPSYDSKPLPYHSPGVKSTLPMRKCAQGCLARSLRSSSQC